jgi:hypothetical protein
MSPASLAVALDVSETRARKLLSTGQIDSVTDGGRLRRVLVASAYDYMVRCAIATDPVDGPSWKFPGGLGVRVRRRRA